MRSRLSLQVLFALSFLLASNVLPWFGPATPGAAAQSPGGTETGGPPPSSLTSRDPKLASSLRLVALDLSTKGVAAARNTARANQIPVDDSRVRVAITAANPNRAGVAGAVAAVGGQVEADYANLVQALVPITSLRALSADASVQFVSPSRKGEPNAIAGEEVVAAGANTWHAAGYDGSGVKVAVIDFGFTGYQAAQAAGELPSGSQLVTHDLCSGGLNDPGGEHGTATAQIVHEMAPGAQLFLICVDSVVQLGNAVTYAISQGVTA